MSGARVQMPNDLRVEQMLAMLKDVMKRILENNRNGIDGRELFKNAYLMVHLNYGSMLYDAMAEVIREHLKGTVIDKVIGAMETSFLETLITAWTAHAKAMELMKVSFMHLESLHVGEQMCYPVYELGMRIFRDEIVKHDEVFNHLRKVLTVMVAVERAGGSVNCSSIKTTCAMLVALGRDVYEECFEAQFLKETAEFYKAATLQFREGNRDASAYLNKVKSWVAKEEGRAMKYLNEETKNKVLLLFAAELMGAVE